VAPRRKHQRGVTLIELLIVAAIAAAMLSITMPPFLNGLDNIRLSQASDQLAAFLNNALNRVERREQPMELAISIRDNVIMLRSVDLAFARKLELPDGVHVDGVLPRLPEDAIGARRFFLLPGGTAPRIGVQLVNKHGQRRIVHLDPITGVPSIENPASQ
jgi:prepilin-type N-terminal cleavage/methylation domain-containing protein